MTSHGHPFTIYDRAVKSRDLSAAHAAAHGLHPTPAPGQTLRLVLLYLECDPLSYPRISARWAVQVARVRPITISQLADLADALHQLAVEVSDGAAALAELEPALGIVGINNALAEARLLGHGQ